MGNLLFQDLQVQWQKTINFRNLIMTNAILKKKKGHKQLSLSIKFKIIII